jgi:hypothetical protein
MIFIRSSFLLGGSALLDLRRQGEMFAPVKGARKPCPKRVWLMVRPLALGARF